MRSSMEVPTDTNGGFLYWEFHSQVGSDYQFFVKSEYANVVRADDVDKKHARLFRLFPKKRALHAYINDDFVPSLKACGFDVKMLSAGRRRFFTPHVAYVTIKSSSKLRDFLTEMRDFYGGQNG